MGARPSGFTAPPVATDAPQETPSARVWSTEQHVIFDWYTHPAATANPNLAILAFAGSGKTSTIVEGVRRAPEETIFVGAYTKNIERELTVRLATTLATVKTWHGLGYGYIRQQWKGMPVEQDAGVRADDLTKFVCAADTPLPIRRLVSKLHTKAREMCPLDWDTDRLVALALQFDCEPDEGWKAYNLDYVVHRAAEALVIAATVAPSRAIGIDYADMIALPLMWDLARPDYQLVVIDEYQDCNAAQLEMATRICAGRMCVVGDDHQQIFGWRGATGSLAAFVAEKQADRLPLTTTYRCARRIVERAQRLVLEIQARPDAPEGQVSTADYTQMLAEAAAGDFVLSRLNAPLVSATLALLRAGKRARMAGREIGAGITTLITKRLKVFPGMPLYDLGERTARWERRTVQTYAERGLLTLVDQTHDTAAMIYALMDGAATTKELLDKLYWLFTDVPEEDQIILSSIHKAKGLEAPVVWLLADSFYRRGRSEEEDHLAYVGITRAIHTLWYVNPTEHLHP